MIDYYLNAADEPAMLEALASAPLEAAIDVIGTWPEQPGYYANVRSPVEIDWPESVTLEQPATPWRVWA